MNRSVKDIDRPEQAEKRIAFATQENSGGLKQKR